AEELAVEDAVGVGIRHDEVRDLEPFGLDHAAHLFGRAVPLSVAVVGMDVVLAAMPAARGGIGPPLHLHSKRRRPAGKDLRLRMGETVLGSARNMDMVPA